MSVTATRAVGPIGVRRGKCPIHLCSWLKINIYLIHSVSFEHKAETVEYWNQHKQPIATPICQATSACCQWLKPGPRAYWLQIPMTLIKPSHDMHGGTAEGTNAAPHLTVGPIGQRTTRGHGPIGRKVYDMDRLLTAMTADPIGLRSGPIAMQLSTIPPPTTKSTGPIGVRQGPPVNSATNIQPTSRPRVGGGPFGQRTGAQSQQLAERSGPIGRKDALEHVLGTTQADPQKTSVAAVHPAVDSNRPSHSNSTVATLQRAVNAGGVLNDSFVAYGVHAVKEQGERRGFLEMEREAWARNICEAALEWHLQPQR
ncbi:hypothetical protein C8Q76DRAFT_697119 [Earliella scabrosa]|nr:hypothetical protein C8Q76DRAFT_697119 [Earliella scabrosa]